MICCPFNGSFCAMQVFPLQRAHLRYIGNDLSPARIMPSAPILFKQHDFQDTSISIRDPLQSISSIPQICIMKTLNILALAGFVAAQCPAIPGLQALDPAKPSAGFTRSLVASDLTSPRGIAFDSAGNLLVVQKGKGIVALTITSKDNCITGVTKKILLEDETVCHIAQVKMSGV